MAEKEAAKAAKQAEKEAAKAAETTVVEGIEVGDPVALRPVELPLVVKPADGGEWKNDAQKEYAAVLNAYAYKNPAKWNAIVSRPGMPELRKKDILVKQLAELGDDPSKIVLYRGNREGVTYKNKLIQQ